MLQRGAEQRLAGQEHHDHLRRVSDLLPVRLGRPAGPCDRGPGARGPAAVAARPLIVVALLRVEERLERRLRVDDDLLAAREVDDEVRAQPAVVRGNTGCSSKSHRCSIPAISTTRRSCISPQRPAHRRRAKRARQRVGRRSQRDHLFGQTRVRLDSLALGLPSRWSTRLKCTRRSVADSSRRTSSPDPGTRRGCP